MDVELRDRYFEGDGVRLHAVEAGSGPAVLLLHGFPDYWRSWRDLLPALARGGFRAIAVDMRGYGLSGRPRAISAYRPARLAADVIALARETGARTIVGHDWGGIAAWLAAARRPDLVERLAVLNAPHPARLVRMLADPRQALRSSYMLLFLLPEIPERLLALRRGAALRWLLRDELDGEDLRRYSETLGSRDALEAALAYYRALRHGVARRELASCGPVHARVLVLWGDRDRAFQRELAEPGELAPGARVVHLDAGHFVHWDRPEEVERQILELARAEAPARAAA